jgi:hypothetical protein
MRTESARQVAALGEIGGKARAFNLWKLRDEGHHHIGPEEAVERLLDELEASSSSYLLVGGLALLQYVEARNTDLVELVLPPNALAAIPEVKVTSRSEHGAQATFHGLDLDLHLSSHPFIEKVVREHGAMRSFGDREVRCATVEGLLQLNFFALPALYRQANYSKVVLCEADIAALLYAYRPGVEALLEEVEPHLSVADLAVLRQSLDGIRNRIERFRHFERSEGQPSSSSPLGGAPTHGT